MVLMLFVVAANLIAPVNTAVAAITTPTYTSSIVSLSSLYTLVFVIIGLLYGFKAFESV